MTEPQTNLVAAAREFATNIFENKVSKSFKYHNLDHTRQVVRAVEEMADYYKLQPEDRNAVIIAAWFHDTGFSSGESQGHEAKSVELATQFLKEHNADPVLVDKVIKAIETTKMPQAPGTLIEQIISDADLFHLGTDEFKIKNEELRQELAEISGEDLSKKKWRKMNITFMENHKYFTDYGKRKLQPVKEKHIAELKSKDDGNGKKSSKKNNKADDMLAVMKEEIPVDASDPKNKKNKDKDTQTERGISTVFRIMASNHASLSQMADSKANIMISVNSIILSVVISVLLRKIEEEPHLIIPTIILILVCVSTIVFAVKATRPNITEGRFTKEDITSKKTNLLFFGNFHNMSLPDYDWGMREMLNSRDYLYGSMVKDIYFLGLVLAKKYKWLRISYNIFMYGLIITMVAYGLSIGYKYLFTTSEVREAPISP
ncbi:MAG TPA: Pycsar system effector family protein [Chitinophagaceae bacterium]